MGQWEEVPQDETWVPSPDDAPAPVYNTAPGSGYRRLPASDHGEAAGQHDFAAPYGQTAPAAEYDPNTAYGAEPGTDYGTDYDYAGIPAPGYASDPDWSDDDEETPFGGIEQVDGLVYSPETVSPELQWQQQQINVPLPPVRERPMPMQHGRAEPWKPGPDPTPPKPPTHSSIGRLMAVTVVPLMVLLGLGMLVYRIMQAYGM